MLNISKEITILRSIFSINFYCFHYVLVLRYNFWNRVEIKDRKFIKEVINYRYKIIIEKLYKF